MSKKKSKKHRSECHQLGLLVYFSTRMLWSSFECFLDTIAGSISLSTQQLWREAHASSDSGALSLQVQWLSSKVLLLRTRVLELISMDIQMMQK